MPGSYQLCRDMKAKCPHCARSLDLSEFGAELFRRIVKRLGLGERIEVEGFGTFRAPVMAGRSVRGLKSNVTLTRDKRVIRFRASPAAKVKVNEKFDRDNKTRRKGK